MALALFVLVSFFWLRVLDKAEYSAFESTLNCPIVSYRIVVKMSHLLKLDLTFINNIAAKRLHYKKAHIQNTKKIQSTHNCTYSKSVIH